MKPVEWKINIIYERNSNVISYNAVEGTGTGEGEREKETQD